MATLNNFVMSYVLMQNTNVKSPVKDRWFAKVNRTGNITTRGLAEYLITLGVALDRSDVEKVLIKLAQAVPGIVAQGYGVKIPGLGIFYPTIANKKGGADSVDDFSVTKNIDGVRFRFRPDSTDLDNSAARSASATATTRSLPASVLRLSRWLPPTRSLKEPHPRTPLQGARGVI